MKKDNQYISDFSKIMDYDNGTSESKIDEDHKKHCKDKEKYWSSMCDYFDPFSGDRSKLISNFSFF